MVISLPARGGQRVLGNAHPNVPQYCRRGTVDPGQGHGDELRYRISELLSPALRRPGDVRKELQGPHSRHRGARFASDGHDAVASILTGSPLSSGRPANSSLDQFLAVESGLGAATRKSNIVLDVGEPNPYPGHTLSFSAGGVGVGKIISPFEAFDYLFDGFAPPTDTAALARFKRRNLVGQSVVDAVREDCNRLRGRLAPPEQQKMDQHLAALRDLEKSFAASGTLGSSCSMLPQRPTSADFPTDKDKLRAFNGGEITYDAVTTYFVDLMAQAFACDITRFATLVMNDLPWDSSHNATTDSLGLGLPSDFHNLVAHKYSTRAYDWENKLARTGDAATWLPLAKYNKYVYGKVARLMQRLDALGALDNVLIYATSELGDPNAHSSVSVPTVLAGGVNVPFRFGRRLQTSPECPTPNDSCNPRDQKYAAGANNHLLVSIAQAFGVEIESFGQGGSAITTGTLAGLT
ncbi:MAG: DUF1552 domain-containing protein [Polyangiaceae bacterium]